MSKDDEEVLNQGKWLNDSLIDAGQKLLKQAFGDKIEGLQDLCLTRTLALNVCSGEFVQVLNKGDCHWYTISTIGCQHPATVRVYDSASKYITYRNKEEIVSLLCSPERKITLHYMNVHIQMGGTDCGLFSLANATALCHGVDPTSCIYDQQQMRKHFWHCLTNRTMELFPLHRKRRIMAQPVKVENFAVYCHCRLPWDRHHAHDDMTMCTVCRDWFHETCDKAKSNIQTRWVGVRCRKPS